MTQAEIQTLFDDSPCVGGLMRGQLEQLAVMLLDSGAIGGEVAAEGENFCFSGTAPAQVFKLKNLDTGLANRLDTFGTDGDQGVQVDVGSSC